MHLFSRGMAAITLALPTLAFSNSTVLYQHDFTAPVSGWCSSCEGRYRVWDSFTLEESSTITQIDARLYISTASSIEFSVWDASRTTQIFASSIDFSAVPTTPAVTVNGSNYYDVSIDFNLALDAGAYSLSIYDGATTSYMGWAQSSTFRDGLSYQTDDGNGFGKDMIFAIHGVSAVPEASTWSMMLIGALGATWRARKHKSPRNAS